MNNFVLIKFLIKYGIHEDSITSLPKYMFFLTSSDYAYGIEQMVLYLGVTKWY